MLLSIHYMRGLAALAVILYHEKIVLTKTYPDNTAIETILGAGYFGVDLFFIISGFVIALSSERTRTASDFLIKRAFRIWPTLIICTIATLIIDWPKTYSGIQVVKQIALIPDDFGSPPPFFGYQIIEPSWTLSYEISFYLLFFISWIISGRHKILISFMSVILLYGLVDFFLYGGFLTGASEARDISNGSTPSPIMLLGNPLMLEFLFGLAAYYAYKKGLLSFGKIPSGIISTALACLFIFGYLSEPGIGHGPTAMGIYALSLFLSILIYEQGFGVKRFIPLIFLGDISYPLYITQSAVIDAVFFIREKTHADIFIKGYLLVFVLIAVQFLISWIIFTKIDLISMRLARRFTSKK